jgi:hypothetical protein
MDDEISVTLLQAGPEGMAALKKKRKPRFDPGDPF